MFTKNKDKDFTMEIKQDIIVFDICEKLPNTETLKIL